MKHRREDIVKKKLCAANRDLFSAGLFALERLKNSTHPAVFFPNARGIIIKDLSFGSKRDAAAVPVAVKQCCSELTFNDVESLAQALLRIPEEVNFFMSNPSNYSKSAAPEGKQMICFTCPHQLDLPEEIEARLVDKMMVTAEKYIPGLSEHIIIKEVLFNSDIMTASGKGGAGIGIGQVAGQTGAYRPKIKLPVEGAYVVGAAAGGAGVGTELAVNSAIEFFDNYCK